MAWNPVENALVMDMNAVFNRNLPRLLSTMEGSLLKLLARADIQMNLTRAL